MWHLSSLVNRHRCRRIANSTAASLASLLHWFFTYTSRTRTYSTWSSGNLCRREPAPSATHARTHTHTNTHTHTGWDNTWLSTSGHLSTPSRLPAAATPAPPSRRYRPPHIYMYVLIYVCMCVCVCVCIHRYMYIYTYIYIYIYLYIYIYTYTYTYT